MSLAEIQSQKALKIANSLFDSSRNLFDPTKATSKSVVNTSNGSLDVHASYYVSDYIPVNVGFKYVANGGQTKNYAWYNSSKTFISGGSNLSNLIAPTNASFIRITIHPDEFTWYQFEQGYTQTDYTPYGVKVNSLFTSSRNLFDPSKATFNKSVNNTNGGLDVNNGYYATDYIPVKTGFKHVASGGQNKSYAWYDVNKTFISGGTVISNLIPPNNAVYIRLTINPADYPTYQFEVGSVQTSYIPYGSRIVKGSQNQSNNRFFGKNANFLGDSITWGYSPIDGSQLSNPYPVLVGKSLGLYSVNNYGVSGSTIGDVGGGANSPFSTRYSSMSTDVDLVFVFGGTNDWAKNVPLGVITDTTNSTYYGALNVLITGLLNMYPTQTIVLATPLHRQGDTVPNASGSTLKDYRNASILIGEKYGIALLDLFATSGFFPDNTTNKNSIMSDGTHPNDVGHVKLANRVTGFLKTL